MRNKIILAVLFIIIGAYIYFTLFNKKETETESTTPTAQVTIAALNTTPISSMDFDANCYTEGLEFYNDKLYAGAGQNGKSFIGVYDTATGKKLQQQKNDAIVFGEGITILNDTLYQLTYESNIVIKYDAKSLKPIGTMPWKFGEGWGLTNNGKQLIATNKTNIIYFLNPNSLAVEKTINVQENGTPIDNVNELEFVDGFIFANRFTTDYIYKIDAATGAVVAKGNFNNLLPGYDAVSISQKQGPQSEMFLNGIAYNKKTGTFFITGKNWPKIFEVKF
jgi:glutaminyl-peptide cyclotransferase